MNKNKHGLLGVVGMAVVSSLVLIFEGCKHVLAQRRT